MGNSYFTRQFSHTHTYTHTTKSHTLQSVTHTHTHLLTYSLTYSTHSLPIFFFLPPLCPFTLLLLSKSGCDGNAGHCSRRFAEDQRISLHRSRQPRRRYPNSFLFPFINFYVALSFHTLGGRKKIFTPMFFFKVRKPLSSGSSASAARKSAASTTASSTPSASASPKPARSPSRSRSASPSRRSKSPARKSKK